MIRPLVTSLAISLIALSAPAAPNILLITADDLGLQLSCYDDPYIETPHLDAIAASGVKFETAYVTTASCSSSRSSMFTGLYPHTTGQIGLENAGHVLAEDQVGKNLPAYLKSAGYRTGILGKLHVAPGSSFPFDYRPKFRDTRDVRSVAKAAATFINDEAEAPFFLMVNYSDPHAWKAEKSDPYIFPNQWKGLPIEPFAKDAIPGWDFQGIDTPTMRERVSNFYSTVKRLDDGIGFLMAELEKSNATDNTLVIFLGDHGPPFNRAKTSVYEAGLRVPFLVRWPGISQAGLESDALVSSIDIVPTVLDAAGIAPPHAFHGTSLRPVVTTPDVPDTWRETLVGEHQYHGHTSYFPRRAIRDQRFKLIHNLLAGTEARPISRVDGDPSGRFAEAEDFRNTLAGEAFARWTNPPKFELYDLENDPHERTNLAGDPAHAETEASLRADLKAWQAATNDPLVTAAGIEKFRKLGEAAKRRMKKK